MGTHPSGPARVNETDELLLTWLSTRPTAVGRVPKNYNSDDLAFMFKVLSIETALSIQVWNPSVEANPKFQCYPCFFKYLALTVHLNRICTAGTP
jgi:mannose-6-phosphate isomerase class I